LILLSFPPGPPSPGGAPFTTLEKGAAINHQVTTEVNTMKCHVCGTSMTRIVSDLPFRVNRSVMIILRNLPLMQCIECGAYAFEERVMERVHEIVERLDSPSHLDAVLYPA